MSELRFVREDFPGTVVLAPSGWIDLSCVSDLQRVIDTILAEDEVHALAIDFRQAEYIDSATVSALIRAKSQAEDKGKVFALVSLAPQVRRVLEETHLIDVFPVFPDRRQFLDQHAETTPGEG